MARDQYNPKPTRDFITSGNRVPSHALYIAKVKSTADQERMGRLRVFVNAFGGQEANPDTWITVRYLTPFYGVTPGSLATPGTKDWRDTQKSYGMWMPPPDIDTQCAVMFEEGDLSKGYVIGYPMDLYMNNMIPGNPSQRLKAVDENSSDYDPELIQQKIARTPVTEYNKGESVRTTPDDTRKPVHPFVDRLIEQGLANDDVRGNTSSSARRESPSQVFGISTPGPVDYEGQFSNNPNIGNFHGAIQDADGRVIKRANSRKGGHTFVMDDGTPQENVNNKLRGETTNELIRLRTRTGHQIVMHDTEGLIYIGTANGNAWMEFTKDGKIDVYAGDSVSVHTKNDFNFKADRDVNIEAGRNINMKADGTVPEDSNAYHDGKLDEVSTGAIRLESAGKIEIKANAEGRIEVNEDFKMESLRGNIDIRASQLGSPGPAGQVIPRKDIRIHATGDINMLAGDENNSGDSRESNINLQTLDNMNIKTAAKFNLDSVGDTSLKSTAKLQVSNAGTDIDGGTINLNSGTASVTTAGESATAEQATIKSLLVHKVPDTDTQYAFPYRTDSRSVTASGNNLQVSSIMKRVPVHEEWSLHENKINTLAGPDRTDREYLEPLGNTRAPNDLSRRTVGTRLVRGETEQTGGPAGSGITT